MGTVTLFLNTGTAEQPKFAAGKLVEADGVPITGSKDHYKKVDGKYVVDRTDVGNHELAKIYSRIHMADWDADGLADLLVGHDHYIIIYRNAGTKSAPKLLGPVKIDVPGVSNILRPSPYVTDWDGDGKQDMLVGTESPKILFFRNIGTAEEPKLAEGESLNLDAPGFSASYRCRFGVTDWNNDGKKDLLVGDFYSSKKAKGKHDHGGRIWLFLGE